MNLDYTHRAGEFDPATQKPRILTRTEITDAGYWPDGSTRSITRQHPDGSPTILLAKAEVIDATGRLWRD